MMLSDGLTDLMRMIAGALTPLPPEPGPSAAGALFAEFLPETAEADAGLRVVSPNLPDAVAEVSTGASDAVISALPVIEVPQIASPGLVAFQHRLAEAPPAMASAQPIATSGRMTFGPLPVGDIPPAERRAHGHSATGSEDRREPLPQSEGARADLPGMGQLAAHPGSEVVDLMPESGGDARIAAPVAVTDSGQFVQPGPAAVGGLAPAVIPAETSAMPQPALRQSTDGMLPASAETPAPAPTVSVETAPAAQGTAPMATVAGPRPPDALREDPVNPVMTSTHAAPAEQPTVGRETATPGLMPGQSVAIGRGAMPPTETRIGDAVDRVTPQTSVRLATDGGSDAGRGDDHAQSPIAVVLRTANPIVVAQAVRGPTDTAPQPANAAEAQGSPAATSSPLPEPAAADTLPAAEHCATASDMTVAEAAGPMAETPGKAAGEIVPEIAAAPQAPEPVDARPVDGALADTFADVTPPVGQAAEPVTRDVAPATEMPRPSPSAAAHPSELARDIGRQLAGATGLLPDRPMELALSPEELGPVTITLAETDAGLSIVITAERSDTLDLMRRHADDLAQEYRALGYGDVSFSFAQHAGDEDDTHAARPEPRDLTRLADAAPAPAPSGPAPSGALDLRL